MLSARRRLYRVRVNITAKSLDDYYYYPAQHRDGKTGVTPADRAAYAFLNRRNNKDITSFINGVRSRPK